MKSGIRFYGLLPKMTAGCVALVTMLVLPCQSRAEDLSPLAQQRMNQQTELDAAREWLRQESVKPGANKAALLEQYNSRVKGITQRYLAQDTRAAQIQESIKNSGLGPDGKPLIENTGSLPKDSRADVDLAAKTQEAAMRQAEAWRARGDKVTEVKAGDGSTYKIVNETIDTTLWTPETEAGRAAKVTDHDAFSTEGGRRGTGNSTAIRDERGWYLDNEKKFIHAEEVGDLKSQAKSVTKAAEGTGVRAFDPEATTKVLDPVKGEMVPSERVKGGLVEKGSIKADNPEFYRQAESLKVYEDPVRAGIVDQADSPAVAEEKIKAWKEQATTEMSKAQKVTEHRGDMRDMVREQFQKDLQSSKPADPANQAMNEKSAETIAEERGRVRSSNAAAEAENLKHGRTAADIDAQTKALEQANTTETGRMTETGTGTSEVSMKPVEGAGAAEGAASKTVGQQLRENISATQGMQPGARRVLAGANEVVGGTAVGGMLGQAGVKQAGKGIDENRDLTAHDAGEALLEGTGVKGMYEIGKQVSTEEQLAVEKGEQGQLRAGARTGLRVMDGMARSMINDPVDQAIAEEEAAAAREGREPDYAKSTYNGFAEVGGHMTGIKPIADSLADISTWEARGDAASQRDAMKQFINDKSRQHTAHLDKLNADITQLALDGDVTDPAVIEQLKKKTDEMAAEHEYLTKLDQMADRNFGKDDPAAVDEARRRFASTQSADEMKGFVREVVTDRGGSLDDTPGNNQPDETSRAATDDEKDALGGEADPDMDTDGLAALKGAADDRIAHLDGQIDALQRAIDESPDPQTPEMAEEEPYVLPVAGPRWTVGQLQNDNWNMNNLAGRLSEDIDDLVGKLDTEQDPLTRRSLAQQLIDKRDDLAGTQGRIRENNSLIAQQGVGQDGQTAAGSGGYTEQDVNRAQDAAAAATLNAMQNGDLPFEPSVSEMVEAPDYEEPETMDGNYWRRDDPGDTGDEPIDLASISGLQNRGWERDPSNEDSGDDGAGDDGGGPANESTVGADIHGDETDLRGRHTTTPGDHTGRSQGSSDTGEVTNPLDALADTMGQIAGTARGVSETIEGIEDIDENIENFGKPPPGSGGNNSGGGGGSGGSGGSGGPSGSGPDDIIGMQASVVAGGGAGGAPSTGSGGANGGKPPAGSGPPGDANKVVVTQSGTAAPGSSGASGTGAGGFSAAPQDQTIDGSAAIGGRTVTAIKVTLNYNAFSIPDEFQILYGGAVLASSGKAKSTGVVKGNGGGGSPAVTIRVITRDSNTSWNWSASVEYTVQ